MKPKARGFTLIELLIVVAIIAILAAIAVPNFLEAQTRAKVSRAKSDMRAMATGLESYVVDWNSYPYTGSNFNYSIPSEGSGVVYGPAEGLIPLSTPTAYLTSSALPDPFPARETGTSMSSINPERTYFGYTARDEINSFVGPGDGSGTRSFWWILDSAGPDRDTDSFISEGFNNPNAQAGLEFISDKLYDPTNGTISDGTILRVGGSFVGNGEEAARFVDARK